MTNDEGLRLRALELAVELLRQNPTLYDEPVVIIAGQFYRFLKAGLPEEDEDA